jgi:hypothetical protein
MRPNISNERSAITGVRQWVVGDRVERAADFRSLFDPVNHLLRKPPPRGDFRVVSRAVASEGNRPMPNREELPGTAKEMTWATSLSLQGSVSLGVIWGMPAVVAFAFQTFWRRNAEPAWIGQCEPTRYPDLSLRCGPALVPGPMASSNVAQSPLKARMFSLLD